MGALQPIATNINKYSYISKALEVFIIKVLQIISGNDNGGGGNHVLNLSYYSKNKFQCIIGTIGRGSLYDRAKELNIKVVKFEGKPAFNNSVISYIKDNNIDLVDFHGAKAFFMHYFLKSKLLIPSVATIHSNYKKDFLNSKFKQVFFTPLSIKGLKSFDYYICVSKYLKKLLEEDNFKGEKFVVNNGINYNSIEIHETREEIRQKYNIKEENFVYVNVARMHPIKNHIGLIEAFGKLRKDLKDIKLILVGDGELENALKEKVNKLGLSEDVIFTGFRKDSLDFVNASDISILTSFSEGGAPPLVVLESAALKKTFICSKVGDMEEIINEERGFLVNPNLSEDIYNKMKKAYHKREELNIMGQNLYTFIKEKYSIESFCSEYHSAYKKILLNR